MIERYGRDVMRQVWTEENKFNAYLKVEILAAEAWRELGVVPAEDVEKLWAKASFSIDRIKEFLDLDINVRQCGMIENLKAFSPAAE